MAVSTIGVADASSPDKYLHTSQRTISGTAREDQYVLQGMGAYPTYSVAAYEIAADATGDHVLQIMGDGSNYSRLIRLQIMANVATSATRCGLTIKRLSSAGTGGSSITAQPFDTTDTYGGGAMTLPTTGGTEGVTLFNVSMLMPTGAGDANYWEWQAHPLGKPIIFGTSTANGIVIEMNSTITGAKFSVNAEFIVTSYL